MNPLLAAFLISLIPAILGAVGFNIAAKYSSHAGSEAGKLHRRHVRS